MESDTSRECFEPIRGYWRIRGRNVETNETVYDVQGTNLVVDFGRADVLNLLFGLGGSSVVLALGVGASSTAAIHTQSQLVYELIGNAKRKALTGTDNLHLVQGDVVSDAYVDPDTGAEYWKLLTVRAIFDASTDGNNGQPFQEYALFNTTTLPSTPTSTSGGMFNRFVASVPLLKNATTEVTVDVDIRV